MPRLDWHAIRFLESAGNLAPLVKLRTGKTCSDGVARDIAACLQQGRQFYESAGESALEIRPLLLYYGMVGFAKAVILASHVRRHSTLAKSHGLRDISPANASASELTLAIGQGDNDTDDGSEITIPGISLAIRGAGTFQQFNDVVRRLHRFRYNDPRDALQTLTFPDAATSDELAHLRVSLKDILGRIPGLHTLYSDTFGEPAATIPLRVYPYSDDVFTLGIVRKEPFTDLASLQSMINAARDEWPFLTKWRLKDADVRWGTSNLTFENSRDDAMAELTADGMNAERTEYENKPAETRFSLEEGGLPILTGGYGGPEHAVFPLDGKQIAEYSLHFLGLFLLSTLVRYRPATWRHSVSRTALSTAPADDRALALIERFLDMNSERVPRFVVYLLNPHEDTYGLRQV